MPITANTEFLSKNIRVQNTDGSKSAFIYYEEDQLKISHVNPDPLSIPTFQAFQFDLSNKSEFYAGESMTSIYIYFDSTIGSSTTISSQNGTISGISPFGPSHFYFNYFNSSITDNLTITSYNSNNTKSKAVVVPITLKTTQTVPLGFANAPTTQNFTYNNIVVNFNKAVKSIASITSLNQPSQTITFTTNNSTSVTLTNYKTPSNIADTLYFHSVIDTANITNISSVSRSVDNLKVGPSFVSVSSSNTISQNWTYTDIEAVFTKNIIQNPNTPITISASSGNQPTNVRVINGNIKFDWTTSNVSSSTLTFNNLYASDFTFDDGATETTTFTLSSQPVTPQWYANQPVSKNTSYLGVEVNFNKRISSVDIVSDGTITNKIINARGNVQFDIITGSTNSTYTFNNIVAEDKGRNTGLILTTGPTITSYANSTGTNNDNKVLIQSSGQLFSFTFNKSISNEPTISINSGSGVFVSKLNNTLTYNLSNITIGSNQITFGLVLASDASSSSGLTVPLVPVPALTFDLISDISQPLISKDTFDVGTLYDLYFKLKDQSLNADFSGVGISINGGGADVGAISQVHNSSSYKFTLKPTVATTTGNDKQLSLLNARDINSFIYPSISSLANLVFKAIVRTIVDLNPDISNTLSLSGSTLVSISSNNTYNTNTWIPTNTSSSIQDYNFPNGATKKVISYYQNPMSGTNVQASNREIVAFYVMNVTVAGRVYISCLERTANTSYALAFNEDGSTLGLTSFPVGTLSQPLRNTMIAFAVSYRASGTDIYWKNGSSKHSWTTPPGDVTRFATSMEVLSTDKRYVLGYGPGSTDWSGGAGKLARFIITDIMPEADIITKLNQLKAEYGV